MRVDSYLRHVCGSRLDCGCCLCGPAQKIAASLPGSSLGCREASAASSSRNEESNVTASGPIEPLLFQAGGLELPQECGNLLPPLFAQQLLLRVGAGVPKPASRPHPRAGAAPGANRNPSSTGFETAKTSDTSLSLVNQHLQHKIPAGPSFC